MDEVLRDSRVSFIEGSITDADLTTESAVLGARVVHLAAESHVDRSITGARAFYDTNVIGTHNCSKARATVTCSDSSTSRRRGLRIDR